MSTTIDRSDLVWRYSGGFILPYDNPAVADFQVGETITGAISTATAVVQGVHDVDGDGILDHLRINTIASGPFQNNEQITGGTSGGTADVDSVSGEFRNNIPDLSLGGEIGDTVPLVNQTATVFSGGISGVTMVRAHGHRGNQLLDAQSNIIRYKNATTALTYQVFDGSEGPEIDVSADGRYVIPSDSSDGDVYLIVDVVTASLPVADASGSVNIDNIPNELWDDISAAEAFVGDAEYRCLYLENLHGTDSFFGVGMFFEDDPPLGELTFFNDPAVEGDGISTGVALIVPDEDTEPAGASWTKPFTAGSAANNISTELAAGEVKAFWMRRLFGGTTLPQSTQIAQPRIVAAADFLP